MRQLGQLEAAVMDRLWAWRRPTLVREVLEDLQRERDIAYTTVMTVMENLHRKGVLVRDRAGRAYRYQPARTREEHAAAMMEEIFSSGADRSATLMHFVRQIDPDEMAALRAVLDDLADGGRPTGELPSGGLRP